MAHGQKSGLYKRTFRGMNFELRLDVDGNQPQNQVSVTITNQFNAHWIADLQPKGFNTWEGPIWFRHEAAQFLRIGGRIPNTLRVRWRDRFGSDRVTLVFMSHTRQLGGLTFLKDSEAFREVEFELDQETGVDFPTSYNLGSHNDRPAGLNGVLSLEEAFASAGVTVRRTSHGNPVSGTNSGFNNAWSVTELHDAMQTHWSRSDGTPWSMWVMAADHFENRPGFVTFGIMFDSIGSFHRNGTAVFNQSIEDFYPANTPQRNETIARHKFRTLVHEIGHAFNLAHSWQKEHPAGTPWSSRVMDEPNALSFMNYPRKVAGGASAYWNDFRFQFSDQELVFMRHAPETFVAMGGESWFKNHGETSDLFGEAELDQLDDVENLGIDSPLKLELRFPNRRPVFKYMEPVVAEVRLTNVGNAPLAVPLEILDPQNLVIHLTRNGVETTQLRPYAHHCRVAKHDIDLPTGGRDYGSVYLSSSANGWNVTDPGRYDVAVELRAPAADGSSTSAVLASAGATFYVQRPDREGERASQDVFSDEVGRVLALGGSKVLSTAVNIVRENIPRLGVLGIAALALPSTREFKRMDLSQGPRIKSDAANEQEVVALAETLIKAGPKAPIELGHVGFSQLSDLIATRSAAVERRDIACSLQENLLKVMENRRVQLPFAVIKNVKEKIATLSGKS